MPHREILDSALLTGDKFAWCLEGFLRTKSAGSRCVYGGDLKLFEAWLRSSEKGEDLREFLALDRGAATIVAKQYRESLRTKLSRSTVNRRTVVLRLFVKAAHQDELVTWQLPRLHLSDSADDNRIESRRIRRAPHNRILRRLRAKLETDLSPRGVRDRAIFALAAELMLRNGEITKLRVGDVDLGNRLIRVMRLGKWAILPLAPAVFAELASWMNLRRGLSADKVFIRIHLGRPIGVYSSISSIGLLMIVRLRGQDVGVARLNMRNLRDAGLRALGEQLVRRRISSVDALAMARLASSCRIERFHKPKKMAATRMAAGSIADALRGRR
jgi:integrase